MSEFFAMGGYAWYVWMSYGACALAVALEVTFVRARRKRAVDELRMSTPEPLRASALGGRSRR
jgi:heme exporter protein CcmD